MLGKKEARALLFEPGGGRTGVGNVAWQGCQRPRQALAILVGNVAWVFGSVSGRPPNTICCATSVSFYDCRNVLSRSGLRPTALVGRGGVSGLHSTCRAFAQHFVQSPLRHTIGAGMWGTLVECAQSPRRLTMSQTFQDGPAAHIAATVAHQLDRGH